ncbi:MAG: DNA alkylation repair protein [Clostridia bacterium]|nr:DNA alkylation repair protein [Clostridia bacterium]
MNIQNELFAKQDKKYKEFNQKLIPTVENERIIGIRTPEMRKFAKQLKDIPESQEFLKVLPHYYFEENNLHAFLIEQIKDFDECLQEVERFLPFIDNWGTCDSLKPPVFKKNHAKLLPKVKEWIKSDNTYTVRFAIVSLMSYFLDDDFTPDMLNLVIGAVCDEYYINMAVAWYFSFALIKQYDTAVTVFEQKKIKDKWTHNKSIQKARESFRIDNKTKEYLKSLKL